MGDADASMAAAVHATGAASTLAPLLTAIQNDAAETLLALKGFDALYVYAAPAFADACKRPCRTRRH